MVTLSNGNIFLVTGPLCAGNSPVTGEFPSPRPMAQSFYVFFGLRQNTRLSRHSRRRWFETPSRSLWRHCNDGDKDRDHDVTNVDSWTQKRTEKLKIKTHKKSLAETGIFRKKRSIQWPQTPWLLVSPSPRYMVLTVRLTPLSPRKIHIMCTHNFILATLLTMHLKKNKDKKQQKQTYVSNCWHGIAFYTNYTPF